MRLKRVRIFGFKSFADRTEFGVDGSVIAVVGPNGCGKSNIVDAILWGLGEGSAKQLRAETGQDVIFSGSAKRKALGYAEVTLLFDNEDGSLPIDTSEVAITRRLSRSGESEYQINRRNCRLKDVLELLADSGLGRAGYAIVTQREIDQALAASPEERRAWVDEAAGVQRYRVRKAESLRRLDAARDHLSRVGDLIAEIERQREPLREDAEVARRYRSIRDSLREVEAGLLIVEVAKAAREAGEAERRIGEVLKLAAKEEAQAAASERASESASKSVGDLERKLDELRARQHAVLTEFERAESSLKLGRQRLESLSHLESSLGEDARVSERHVSSAKAEIEKAAADEVKEREALERTRVETAGAGDDARKLAKRLEQLERDIEAAREAHLAKVRRDAEADHRKERLAEIARELKGIDAGLPDLQNAEKEAQQAREAAEKGWREVEERIEAAQAELREASEAEEAESQESRALLSEKGHLEGRKNGIEATLRSHEGLHKGARAILEAARKGVLKGEFRALGESLAVEPEYAEAIETALGWAANDLVVEDVKTAKSVLAWLKSQSAGRATLRPLEIANPGPDQDGVARLLKLPGVRGVASSLAACDERIRPAVECLLNRVLVVDDLETALRLPRSGEWSRAVTLQGEVVDASGAVTGGVHDASAGGLVQRRSELTKTLREIERIESRLKELAKKASSRQKERDKVASEIQRLRIAEKSKRGELEEARSWAQSLADELATAEKDRAKLQAETERLARPLPETQDRADLSELEAARTGLLRELAVRSADADQAETKMLDAEQRVLQAEERRKEAERRLAHALDHERNRRRRLEHIEPDRKKAAEEIEAAEKSRAELAKSREEVGKQLHETQERRRLKMEESFRAQEEARAARAHAQAATEAAHQAELQRARADAKRAASAQRLLEEYGLTENDALEKEPSIELPKDAASVTAKLRRELRAMGDVNLGAVEMYERLEQRHEELEAQRQDILSGMAEVESSIRELDELTRERFVGTFEKVREAFAEMTVRIFQGGEGIVRLTDPNDLLSSGIEIDVTLPGKKRQKLELLSGGERSLCATAFLFSLLKVKPSPLVILDEVDAPLDGRNVERFVEMLKEFSKTIQFVIVTHNATTIAASPVWLGVTMQEPGVSTLVPATLPPESEDHERSVAAVAL